MGTGMFWQGKDSYLITHPRADKQSHYQTDNDFGEMVPFELTFLLLPGFLCWMWAIFMVSFGSTVLC